MIRKDKKKKIGSCYGKVYSRVVWRDPMHSEVNFLCVLLQFIIAVNSLVNETSYFLSIYCCSEGLMEHSQNTSSRLSNYK